MAVAKNRARRCILGVFAHPDDETSSSAGTFIRYALEGVEVYVATATRGEQGTLGTGGTAINREELPAVRERELRSVLKMYGARPPTFLGYRDGELVKADFLELVAKVASVMERIRPDVVITFGPTGISHHDDHVTIHRATVEAYHRYRASVVKVGPRLFYVAIPEREAKQFELSLHETELTPTVVVDIKAHKATKIQALRMYRSQADAQELANVFEANPFDIEGFHQAYPPLPQGQAQGRVSAGFWE